MMMMMMMMMMMTTFSEFAFFLKIILRCFLLFSKMWPWWLLLL